MTIRDTLVPVLQAAFPGRGLRISDPPEPVAVFPAACAEVGAVMIYDDGDEATTVIENVTHHHDDPYDSSMSADVRAQWITEQVVEFLRDLFSDKVLLWSIKNGQGGGGWLRPYDGTLPVDVPAGADTFVWSRRISSVGRMTEGGEPR